MRCRRWLLGVALSLVACALSPTPRSAPATSPTNPLTILFFDVGQGDAALIHTPDRKRILVDAGPSERVALFTFSNMPFDTLDLVVASHNHADHIGGMPWVLSRFAVRAYVENGLSHTTVNYAETLAALRREPGLMYLEATERTVRLGDVALRILPPSRLDDSQNNNSVGILVEYGAFRALFTGDAEQKQLDHWVSRLKLPRVHVLKAAHHGGSNGATAAFIAATQPSDVIVAVGRRNSYGHPAPATIAAWERVGARVHRTDVVGPMLVVARPDGTHHVLTIDGDTLSRGARP